MLFPNYRSYVNSGPRSLPHMGGSKRHNGNGHNGNGHSGNGHGHGHNSNGHNGARLSPPMQSPQVSAHNNNNNTNQHDILINYIYESWNKVIMEDLLLNIQLLFMVKLKL